MQVQKQINYQGAILDITASVSWPGFAMPPEIEVEIGSEGDYERGQMIWDEVMSEGDRRLILAELEDMALLNAETV